MSPLVTAFASAWLLLIAVPALPAPTERSLGAKETLGLIRSWVTGRYSNARQAEQDLADHAVPDDEKHRLMHQLFVPVLVNVPAIPGYLVFQQSSVDGTEDPDTITRVGLLQFFVDGDGRVRQRELNFRDLDAFKNVHRTPERLRDLRLDQFRFDAGCDFILTPDPSGKEIAGPMRSGACRFFSAGLNRELTADDAVTIRPDAYFFLGRFVDGTGKVVWGNSSPQPVRMFRLPGGAGDADHE